MNKIDEAVLEAISKISDKGEPIVTTGTTGSGKSALEEACAKNPIPQKYLELREASGKGSLVQVSSIATDYEAIPEDKLIMLAEINTISIAECGDDNELIGNVLYSAAKDYYKSKNEAIYKDKITKSLSNFLQHPANDSLAYKIKDIKSEDKERLIGCFMSFQIESIMSIYNEMLANNPKKGQTGVRIFIELLKKSILLKNAIEGFWNTVVEFINRDVENFKNQLVDCGAYVEEKTNGGYKFIAVLGEEDINKDFVTTLLKSEDGSKEYLLSNITLIFRGADYIFDVPNKDALTVSEIDGVKVHCIRLIDTQGLFHSLGVNAKDEAERIVDLLTEYHSNKLIIVVNSSINSTVKVGYDAITMMLQDVNRDIDVYFLFTHWDEYLKSFGASSDLSSKFCTRRDINWENKFTEAKLKQDEVFARFNEALISNTSKKKPQIVQSYCAAILSDTTSKMEDILDKQEINYPNALQSLFAKMVSREQDKGMKYRVLDGICDCVSIKVVQSVKQNISALYRNIVDCKDKKYYASTVRACKRKWCNTGDVHESFVVANDFGFENIKTTFVQEIRNYTMPYVKQLKLNAEPLVLNEGDYDAFVDELTEYLNAQQKVGHEVAKMIGDEAYQQSFVQSSEIKYQYEHFSDMLQYVQENYFPSFDILFSDKFESCLLNSVKKCIKDFIDSKCIEVY